MFNELLVLSDETERSFDVRVSCCRPPFVGVAWIAAAANSLRVELVARMSIKTLTAPTETACKQQAGEGGVRVNRQGGRLLICFVRG